MKTFVVRPSALASALASASLLTLAFPASPQTLPAGLQVISGQAQVATQGNAMTVTNTSGAVLNWNSFNIGAGASVRFDQPGSSSQVLNRVVGNDPSTILGRLSSNGRVWLLNPNGVLFGENARIDVAGLVASTLRLNDDDWRAGRWSFTADPVRRGDVTNRGELRSAFGGQVALIGGSVRNDGLIEAPGGQVVLAAGAQVELVDTGVPHLAVRVRSPEGRATNLGQIIAPGGRIDVHAAAVNQNGIVRADSLTQGPGGEIVIRASGGLDVSPSAVIAADGASAGGQVTLDAGEGRLNLQGSVSTLARRGRAGDMRLLGREVALLDGARVDASGSTGGGEVLAGGGLQGRDASYANANALYMSPGASIRADALDAGNGGRIVLWSDSATRAFGSLSARAGISGGDGGFIETSGGWLDARPAQVDLAAPRGATGRWLLDPYDILITDRAPTNNVSPSFTATGSPASINGSVIAAALSAGTSVTISTGGVGVGSEAGGISLGAGGGLTLRVSGASPGSLTLIAENYIIGSAVSISSSGPMPVTMLAGRGGSGGISLSATSISTAGGSITLGGFGTGGAARPGGTITGAARGNSAMSDGVHLSSVTLNAGSGSVSIKGIGATISGANGVTLDSNSQISGRSVLLQGDGPAGVGVEVVAATVTATSTLSVQGVGGSSYGVGVYAPSTLQVLPAGPSPSSLLEIWGRNPTGNVAVMLDAGSSSSALLATTGSARLTVSADNCGCDDPAMRILGTSFSTVIDTSSGGGPISIGVHGDGQQVSMNGSQIFAGTGGVTLDGYAQLSLNNAHVSSSGPVRLLGDNVSLTGFTNIFSSAAGDAIVVAGGITPQLSGFFNSAGSGSLFASSGRWIVYADTPFSEGYVTGGLPNDFTRYGSFYGGWSGDAGNGLVFALPVVATVSGSVVSKVYDGTTTAIYTGLTATGPFGESGSLAPGVTVSFADKNVGSPKPLVFSAREPFAMTDFADKPVYGFTYDTTGLSAAITPRSATVTGLSVVTKLYDATTDATLGGAPVFTGLIPGDVVTLAGSTGARFIDKNAGFSKPVTLSGVVFGGADGGNYDFKVSGSLTGTIIPRSVTISGLSAADKVYDGTTTATISGSPVVEALPGDTVTAAGIVSGAFADKNVGSGKPVAVTGLTLGGPDAPNYTLAGSGGLTADITKRPLVVSGLTAVDKVYDATTVAALTGSGRVTPLPGDSVAVGAASVGSFADKNAGTNKPVLLTGVVLTGADAGNYAPEAPGTLTATITPRPVTPTGLVANNKVYDGTTAATLSGSATVTPLGSDVVAVTGTAAGEFADKNVGRSKPVTVSGLSLAGPDSANYALQPIAGLAADITPLLVPVTGLTALPKTYDATTNATLSGTPAIDPGSGPGLTLTGTAVGNFADKNAGLARPVLVSGLSLTGPESSNYQLQYADLRADIAPRVLSTDGVIAVNKVYDGSNSASLLGISSIKGLPGDLVALSGTLTASFGDKNVGVNKPVSVSGLELIGADAANYRLSTIAGLTANISARTATVAGLTAENKIYDGTAIATVAGTPVLEALSGDIVSASGTVLGTFLNKDVGIGKQVLVSGLVLAGPDAGNYNISGTVRLTADITPRPTVVSGLLAADKVYDSTTAATLSGSAKVTPLAGDVVSVAGIPNAQFSDKNVGVKQVVVSGVVLVGPDAANYLPVSPTDLVATIVPRPITATGLVANSKIFDGTTAATFSGTATMTPLGSDVVAIAGTASGEFADKNVGRAKPVSVSGLSLAGPDSANYTLQPITGLVADITPVLVPVTGLAALPKTYDATTAAALTGTPVIDADRGPGLSLSGTAIGSFADKNAGLAKPVLVSGLTLSGPEAGNYQLQYADLRADITPRTLSVDGIRAASRVYDGTTIATLTGVAGVTGLPGDVVSISGDVAGRFADKNVGTGKAVTVSGLGLVGADAANYRLTALASLAADITPLQLTIGGLSARDKVYDATTAATLSGSASISPVAGDALVLSGSAVARFADKNAGTNKAVTVTGLSLGGADAGNYRLLPVAGLTATISPLTVAVTGLSAGPKVYDGTTTAPLIGTAAITTLAGDAASLSGTAAGTYTDRNVGTSKAITISGLALSGADAGNYRLSLPSLRGDITQATLQYVATPIERLFGQPVGAVGGTVSGLVGGDTLATATTGTLSFSTPAVTGSPVGSYAINGAGLASSNYRLVQAAANATALSIVRLPPDVAADSGANLGVDAVVQTVLPQIPAPNPTIAGVADLTVPLPPAGGVAGTGGTAGSGASGAAPGGATVSTGASSGAFSSTSNAASRSATAASLFDPVVVASRSSNEMLDVLAARERYKQEIFAEAIAKLEQNPALADLRPCATLQEAQAGTCLVTEELKQQYAAQVRVAAAAPAPAAPAPSATPAPAPVAPAVSSPAPAVAPPPAPAARAPASPAPALPEVIERKRVVTAALPQIERKVALLVGVDEYRDATIPALANAVKDARTVGRLFAGDLGYETYVVPNASRQSVVAALNRLALELRPHDSVVIYYAGHGQVVESTKLGYWQLGDADAKDPATWLSNTDITRLVGRIGASQVAVISDSCYSGSLVAEQKLRAATGPVDPVAVLTRKSVVVMSSGGNEPVFDDGKQGHSPFAWNLMTTLRQVQTWQAGGQVFERVRFAVARELPQRPQYGASTAAGHQPGGDYLFESRQIEAAR